MNRRQRITSEQKTELVERVIANYQIAASRFTSADGKRQKIQFWNTLTVDLNAMEGADKNVSGWQKSFYDIRNTIREKFRRIRNHANRTGGGEALDLVLDPLEERLLSVVPAEHVDGLDCAEGGFSTATIPNALLARSAIMEEDTRPILPSDSALDISSHPTYSIEFENSILPNMDYSDVSGPSTDVVENQALTPPPPSSTDQRTNNFSRPRNLYRTSLTKNSQRSLRLQEEAIKEIRANNRLMEEWIRVSKETNNLNERRHRETTALLRELIELQRQQQN